jgi:hypothetical protein
LSISNVTERRLGLPDDPPPEEIRERQPSLGTFGAISTAFLNASLPNTLELTGQYQIVVAALFAGSSVRAS